MTAKPIFPINCLKGAKRPHLDIWRYKEPNICVRETWLKVIDFLLSSRIFIAIFQKCPNLIFTMRWIYEGGRNQISVYWCFYCFSRIFITWNFFSSKLSARGKKALPWDMKVWETWLKFLDFLKLFYLGFSFLCLVIIVCKG